ncbi:MAG: Asp-tRNA(Asn)/Glu-tRNA(Gln) amidotransferase subunit GatC [Phycisphaeraceae bacterium]|nr:Asp-tRNA(Asn)/Glu-tRNA(Gln) amidotransferase subunit GatC [Phycisphaeraceae bacterium]
MTQSITEQDVRHVARLSRLKLSDEEVRHFTQQLGNVMQYIAKLSELDVTNVEPMAHALDMSNVLREDEPQPGMDVDLALANAPDRSTPFFKVPKVLGEGSGA